jgi:hypothetical protein
MFNLEGGFTMWRPSKEPNEFKEFLKAYVFVACAFIAQLSNAFICMLVFDYFDKSMNILSFPKSPIVLYMMLFMANILLPYYALSFASMAKKVMHSEEQKENLYEIIMHWSLIGLAILVMFKMVKGIKAIVILTMKRRYK